MSHMPVFFAALNKLAQDWEHHGRFTQFECAQQLRELVATFDQEAKPPRRPVPTHAVHTAGPGPIHGYPGAPAPGP